MAFMPILTGLAGLAGSSQSARKGMSNLGLNSGPGLALDLIRDHRGGFIKKSRSSRPGRARPRKKKQNGGTGSAGGFSAGAQTLPRAISQSFNPYYKMTSTATGARVRGIEFMRPFVRLLNQTETYIVPASPSFWTGTRIEAMSRLFSYYRPNKVGLRYMTASGTDTGGTVVLSTLAFTDRPGGTDTEMMRALSTKPWHDACPPWGSATMMSGEPIIQRLYTLGEWGDNDFGSHHLVAHDTESAGSAGTLGQLWVEYDITFETPAVNTPSARGFEEPVKTTITLTDGDETGTNRQLGSFLVASESAAGGDLGLVAGDVLQVVKEAGTSLIWRAVKGAVPYAVDEITASITGWLYNKAGQY